MHYKTALIITLLLTGCRVESDEKAWSMLLAGIRTAYPDVVQLSTAEFDSWLNDPRRTPPLLLDARTPEEFEVSHLRDARLAANHNLAAYPKDQPMVTYCSVGARSSALARALQQKGFTRVYNLEGSIFQWVNEGRPVVRDGRPVNEVHPYDEKWGRFLNHEKAREIDGRKKAHEDAKEDKEVSRAIRPVTRYSRVFPARGAVGQYEGPGI